MIVIAILKFFSFRLTGRIQKPIVSKVLSVSGKKEKVRRKKKLLKFLSFSKSKHITMASISIFEIIKYHYSLRGTQRPESNCQVLLTYNERAQKQQAINEGEQEKKNPLFPIFISKYSPITYLFEHFFTTSPPLLSETSYFLFNQLH